MTLWDKGTPLNKVVAAFTVGNDYLLDQRLVKYDCTASIAHAEMLGQIGVLQEKEVSALTALLQEIIRLNEKGEFEILPEHEDCHTAIELHVTLLAQEGRRAHQQGLAIRAVGKVTVEAVLSDRCVLPEKGAALRGMAARTQLVDVVRHQ